MEATSIYSFATMFFQEDIDLKAFNTQSVVVDPESGVHDVFMRQNDHCAYYIAVLVLVIIRLM